MSSIIHISGLVEIVISKCYFNVALFFVVLKYPFDKT